MSSIKTNGQRTTSIVLIHLPEGARIDNLDKLKCSFENKAGKLRIVANYFGSEVNIQVLIEQKEYNFSPLEYTELKEYVLKTQQYLDTVLDIKY